MVKFNLTDFNSFVTDYQLKNGELATEYNLNLSSSRLKKELNHNYNVRQILNGNRLLDWNPVETYLIGELCQNTGIDDNYYRARRQNTNKRPDLYSDNWEIAVNTDYTEIGDFNNFLAKDNDVEYTPTEAYHPSTKLYVDELGATKLGIDCKAVDSSKLNGEIVQNTLGTNMNAPASQNLVTIVNDKCNTKLPITDFNGPNIMELIRNVDGALSGLDADLLDGRSSEDYMFVGDTDDLDTLFIPGSYIVSPGALGAPDMTGTFAVLVSGGGNYFNHICTSIVTNKLYFRSYNGNWSAWKEFASSSGNVATASKLASPVTIAISGDVNGSVSFDGSQNVDIVSTVLNDSHTHDTMYYTETESDARFLPLHAKADDSELLDNLNSTQFLRSDIDTALSGNLVVSEDLIIQGNLNVTGTTTSINTEELTVKDKNIELGIVTTPTDATADGGGITLKGTTDKTILWNVVDNRWYIEPGIQSTFYGTSDDALKLTTPVTIELSGDVVGSAQFDGSGNVNIVSVVQNDTHTHDTRYYTETESDARFLSITAKAVDSDKLDGYDSSYFSVKSDTDTAIGLKADTTYVDTELALKADNHTHPYLGITAKAVDSDKLDGYDSSVTAVADTVVVRDGSGNINGTSSSAEYADLAEMYTTDCMYDFGTVVCLSDSDDYDITKIGDVAFGVISKNPGFILDNDLKNALPVALIGKTPVKVKGKIKKGDYIKFNGDGTAIKFNSNGFDVLGRALESSDNEDVKLIKCFVRI